MDEIGSVTGWWGELQAGNPAAAQHLWERYFRRLVGLARLKLRDAPRQAADEEDVALSAFDSFCQNAQAGRFPQLADRDGLWRLLVTITARKAGHLRRDQGRQKRGGGMTALEPTDEDHPLDEVLSREPSPEVVAQIGEEYRRLLGILANPELESVVQWRLEGYTVEEIAARMGYAPRSIKRKLHAIRDRWKKEITYD